MDNNTKLEAELLKVMSKKDNFNSYLAQVNRKRLLPNTELLLSDYEKYFEINQKHEEINWGLFYSQFAQDWHNKDLTEEQISYYKDYVFPAIEQASPEDVNTCLVGLIKKHTIEDILNNANDLNPEKLKDILNSFESKVSGFSQDSIDPDANTLSMLDFKELDQSHGIPYFLPTLQENLGSLVKGQLVVVAADFGTGKEQPLSAKISTPNGWVRMGDIKLGDIVNGYSGTANVVGVFPQGVKPVYKLTFNDGRECEAGLEHLFEVRTKWGREQAQRGKSSKASILSLKEIINSNKEYYIKTSKPVEKTCKDYIIPPYSLGVLLGDGCLTDNGLVISSNELDVISKVAEELDLEIKKQKGGNYSWLLKTQSTDKKHYRKYLKEKKLLCVSSDKYIPEEYLHGSVDQRMRLLKGLIDTDGSVGNKNRFRFSTTSSRLKDDFIELCRSLGFIAKVTKDNRDKYKNGICFNISILTDEIIFSSNKHMSRYDNNYNNIRKHRKYADHIKIVNIEYVRDEESQCIMLDSEDHLYLTNDYVVTHNTAFVVSQAAETLKHLKKTNDKRPILYFNSEGTLADVGGKLCANLFKDEAVCGFEEIIENADLYTDKFKRFVDEDQFLLYNLLGASVEWVEQKVKKHNPALTIIDITDILAGEEDVKNLKKFMTG